MDLKDQVGTTRQSRFRVERRHTVPALPLDRPAVTEMPEVLATPMLVAMMEAACIEHIAGLVAAPGLAGGSDLVLQIHGDGPPRDCGAAVIDRSFDGLQRL